MMLRNVLPNLVRANGTRVLGKTIQIKRTPSLTMLLQLLFLRQVTEDNEQTLMFRVENKLQTFLIRFEMGFERGAGCVCHFFPRVTFTLPSLN